MFFAHVMWGPGVLGGHSPQAFLITGFTCSLESGGYSKFLEPIIQYKKEVFQKRPTGEHAADNGPTSMWKAAGGPNTLRSGELRLTCAGRVGGKYILGEGNTSLVDK